MASVTNGLIIDALRLLGLQDAAPNAAEGSAASQFFNLPTLLLMSMVLFFLLVLRPQRNEMKKLQQRLAELKKNDRVITSGGIHGVVVQANSGEPTIVLRIDENSGAKMTVNRDAIAKVLNSDSAEKSA